MSPRRRAQLLLPTRLGLVEYDVLEDAAFVGPSPRGGLTADPSPFLEAVAALTWSDRGFVLRALPGEAEPKVNGEPAADRVLSDGDRLEIAGQVVAFRTDARRASIAPAPPADAGDGPARGTGRARRLGPRYRANPYVTAVALSGLLLLLLGLFLALEELGNLRADERVTVYVPAPPSVPAVIDRAPSGPEEAYGAAVAWEQSNPSDADAIVERYRAVMRSHPASPEADQARARIREVVDEAGRQALARLEEETKAFVREKQFNSALAAIRAFERRHGATPSADEVPALRRRVREAARQALDALLAEVGPMVATNPRRAHRTLLIAGPEYPPDLAAEITGLMELSIDLMRTQGPPPPERPEPPVEPGRPPREPREPGERPRDPQPPEDQDPPKDDTILQEAEAKREWQNAHLALKAGRYQEALDGYTLLALRYGGTDVYREHRGAIVAGRFAAKVGAQGPAGLLSVPVEEKRGVLTVEYTFDDARVVDEDFSVEQPFPSDRPVSVKVEEGAVHMKDASGLFHVLLWDKDVRVEAKVVAEVAHDIGALAVAETEEYRAILLNINNTLFKLKKGPAARGQPGHLLWFVGQGVWSAADADAIGYVKIAERTKVNVENGDRLTIELIRKGDQAEGSFQGRTDGVALKGAVKGDDGSGMGSARVGLFTNTGAMLVESLTITGKVDAAWFQKRLAELVGAVAGPGE